MAFDNQEIEIKIVLNSEKFNRIQEALTNEYSNRQKTRQIDTYYSPSSENYLKEQFPYKWLSIRKRDGKSILNYKHFFPEREEKHTHCDEYEVEISGSENMHLIFKELGINEIVTVDKVRETFRIEDKYEVVLDTVANLGHFLEIEALKDMGGVEHTRMEMMNFLEYYGLNDCEVDYRGYPFQLIKQNPN